VIAVDLASFGESGNNRSEWTMTAFAEDVTAVIEKLKLKEVVLVGFSLGATVAIETAIKLPDLVSGVVIVDNLHDVDMQYPPQDVSNSVSMMMDLVSNPSIEKFAFFFRNDVEESYQLILSMLGDGPRTGWSESLHGYMQWLNEDYAEALGNLKAPVIAINSTMLETNVEAFRKYVPSFKVKIIPDTGHILMWDATEEFNRLLEQCIQEFLKK
jgi:pimeloyl-ACP methyl ester carboxylesterase